MQSREFSLTDYLRMEEMAETKHEYWDGQIVDMAGATWEHGVVVSNLSRELGNRLHDRCRVVTSDQRVRLSQRRYVYPDVVVVCGKPELTDERPPSLLNPTLLVEVLSESTSRIDTGDKLDAYRNIVSLQEYWIVDDEGRRTLQYMKGADWNLHIYGFDSILRSKRLGIELPLRDVLTI